MLFDEVGKQSIPSPSTTPVASDVASSTTTTAQDDTGDAILSRDPVLPVPSSTNQGPNPSRVVISNGLISGGVRIPGSSTSIGVVPAYVNPKVPSSRPSGGTPRLGVAKFCSFVEFKAIFLPCKK